MSEHLPAFEDASSRLPTVLAGPLLRRIEARRIVLWLVARRPLPLTLKMSCASAGNAQGDATAVDAPIEWRIPLGDTCCQVLPIGKHAYIHFIDVCLEDALPVDTDIAYDILIGAEGHAADEDPGVAQGAGLATWAPHLLHDGATAASFVLRGRADNILYGSCRKPHHSSADGLVRVDKEVQRTLGAPHTRPALLMLCGDQVYVDDVAGPMLVAVHALIERLGLFDEVLEGALVADSQALYAHPDTYYRREKLLPAFKSNEALRERFFGGVEKPVFTTSSAHNHLLTFAEMMAMYMLVWSPIAWTLAGDRPMPPLDDEHVDDYRREARILDGFRTTLPQAARAMAHLPTLMIFDDHDVTDDWNLSARWEEEAYGHPFSRRIVGNALLAYALCQGWGNTPEVFGDVLSAANRLMHGDSGEAGRLKDSPLLDPDQDRSHTDSLEPAADASAGCASLAARGSMSAAAENALDPQLQDSLIGALLDFRHWGYVLPTEPAIIVLDTRTCRWHSTRLRSLPSGLMDWEALCELQQALLDKPSAVIVSPAPMFGVKLIEAVQRIFTWLGHSLVVDAENWMAHRGAAKVMMNIFRHSRTPGNYVILSGDVHYSFMYDIQIRHRDGGRTSGRSPAAA